MVTVNVPSGVFFVVTIVITEVPEPRPRPGTNLAVAWAGKPCTHSLTVPVNPPSAAICTVPATDDRRFTASDSSEAVTVKSGLALTASVTVVEWTSAPAVPVTVTV